MKKTLHILWTDMKQSLFSLRFLCSVLAVPFLMLTAIWGMTDGSFVSAWYLARLALGGSGLECMILCTLPVFAFGLSYAREWEEKAVRCQVIRAGTGRYALSRTLNCALSGFLTVFLGIGLFVLILLPVCPPHLPDPGDAPPYEALMGTHLIPGWLLYMAHHGLSGSIVSVCALWFSTLLPNRFAAAAAPFILYFSILRLNFLTRLPAWTSPVYWISGVWSGESCLETIGYKLITALALCALFGIAARYHIERRLLHE